MRPLPRLLLVAALAGAGGAFAQAVNAPAGAQPAQRGFFPPTPGDDPSLFHTLPPEAYVRPGTEQPTQSRSQPAASHAAPPIVVVVPDANVEARAELERAQIEAQQAAARKPQAPAPINGAFTGATDEADRR